MLGCAASKCRCPHCPPRQQRRVGRADGQIPMDARPARRAPSSGLAGPQQPSTLKGGHRTAAGRQWRRAKQGRSAGTVRASHGESLSRAAPLHSGLRDKALRHGGQAGKGGSTWGVPCWARKGGSRKVGTGSHRFPSQFGSVQNVTRSDTITPRPGMGAISLRKDTWLRAS